MAGCLNTRGLKKAGSSQPVSESERAAPPQGEDRQWTQTPASSLSPTLSHSCWLRGLSPAQGAWEPACQLLSCRQLSSSGSRGQCSDNRPAAVSAGLASVGTAPTAALLGLPEKVNQLGLTVTDKQLTAGVQPDRPGGRAGRVMAVCLGVDTRQARQALSVSYLTFTVRAGTTGRLPGRHLPSNV